MDFQPTTATHTMTSIAKLLATTTGTDCRPPIRWGIPQFEALRVLISGDILSSESYTAENLDLTLFWTRVARSTNCSIIELLKNALNPFKQRVKVKSDGTHKITIGPPVNTSPRYVNTSPVYASAFVQILGVPFLACYTSEDYHRAGEALKHRRHRVPYCPLNYEQPPGYSLNVAALIAMAQSQRNMRKRGLLFPPYWDMPFKVCSPPSLFRTPSDLSSWEAYMSVTTNPRSIFSSRQSLQAISRA